MALKVVQTISNLKQIVKDAKLANQSIGVVPTMGALHAGHISLAITALEQSDVTIATIFVNPTQFAAGEDLESYPRNLESDIKQLSDVGIDYVFTPEPSEVYPSGFSTYVDPPKISKSLEGEHRPTHFRGVATVVLKLLNMTRADKAFFGQKDFQQALVVRQMVDDLNVPCEIVTCPILRDEDGLALSSRNRYLSDDQRAVALCLNRTLQLAESLIRDGERDTHIVMNEMKQSLIDGGVDSIDYAMVANADDLTIPDEITLPAVCLVAAYVGTTRLIDNCVVQD